MIKEYIIEKFSGSCAHVPDCVERFIHDDSFEFCAICDFKDFLLSCNRSAMLIEEEKEGKENES